MLKQFELRKLLAVVFTLMLFTQALGIAFSVWGQNHEKSAYLKREQASELQALTLRAKFHIVQIQQFLTDASLTKESEAVKEAEENEAELSKVLSTILNQYPETKPEIEPIVASTKDLSLVGHAMYKAYTTEGFEAGNKLMKADGVGLDAVSETLAGKMEVLMRFVEKNRAEAEAEFTLSMNQLSWIGYTISALTIIELLILLAMIFSRLKPLSQLMENLAERAKVVYDSSMNLEQVSNKLKLAAHEQSVAAKESLNAIADVSVRGESTSKAAVDMSSQAKICQASVQTGLQSVTNLIQLVQSLKSMNETMSRDVRGNNTRVMSILDVFQEVEAKTPVIDEIVFQTKLLSFNASVEAARAGEHGKGFAIVAEEVGKLAGLSGKASHEISDMLKNSVERVKGILESTQTNLQQNLSSAQKISDEGSSLAKECESSFGVIERSISQLLEQSTQIKAETGGQSAAVHQIEAAVGGIAKSASQGAELAMDTASSSEYLEVQSKELDDIVLQVEELIKGQLKKVA